MSKLWKRIAGLLGNRAMAGVDKAGNKYFARTEQIDGVSKWFGKVARITSSVWRSPRNCAEMKEKRWVVFKGEEDPTSIPVEWICWLNGQRKKAPTVEEMMELEAKRERVRLNVALLKKEEEERRSKEGIRPRAAATGKVGGPELRSFIQQFPADSKGDKVGETSGAMHGMRNFEESETDKEIPPERKQQPESSEPTGSGPSFRPGTWQPPT